MLCVLFGTPAVGKNFVGQILKENFDFHFYDADVDLPPKMRAIIANQGIFTQAMRDEYFKKITEKLKMLTKNYERIVMAQAFAKEKNRSQLLRNFPQAKFLWVKADVENINLRLAKRNDWVTIKYAAKIRNIFEPPLHPHKILDNNKDEAHVLRQLEDLVLIQHQQS